MQEPTSQPSTQPSPALTPQPNQILAVPATVELCNADYDDASDVRQTMAQQDARHRS